MPSGFLILADGRCLAVRWLYYDQALRAVADSLEGPGPTHDLREWLLTLLPGPDDEEELGYGAWLRSSDQEVIRRHLDVRELAPENRRMFHEAALRAVEQMKLADAKSRDPMLMDCLVHLANMVERANRGEPPLSLSDWIKVEPPTGKRIGPGWNLLPDP